MGIHKTASCRYCADTVDVEWLARHEERCKTLTPDERKLEQSKRKQARDAYRAKVGLSAAPNANRDKYRASMAVPLKNKNGIRRASSPCRYCHEPIAQGQMPRHEVACAKRTPEERTAASALRGRQREYNRRNYQNSLAVVAKRRMGRPPGSHSLFTNGTGKRLSATISIDFKSFREMLLQLAPMLSIDKVEVL